MSSDGTRSSENDVELDACGPEPTLDAIPDCCGRSPLTGHSPRVRNLEMAEFTVCGQAPFRCGCAKVSFQIPPPSGRRVAGWHPVLKLRHAHSRISCNHFATGFCDSQPLEIIHPQKALQNRSVLGRGG